MTIWNYNSSVINCAVIYYLHDCIFIVFLNVFYNRFLEKILYTRVFAMAFHHFTQIYKFDTHDHSLKSRMQERNLRSTTEEDSLSHRSWISITHQAGSTQAALRKSLSAALSTACAVKNQSVGDASVLRCIIIIMDPRSSLAPPHFLMRVEYEAVGFPCIRHKRFYLWLPAPTSYDIVSAGSQNLRDRWLG